MKTAGKIIKLVLKIFIFALCALVIARIVLTDLKLAFKNITPTENAKNAYSVLSDDAFFTNDMNDTTSGNWEGRADGYFSAYSFVYIPECGEVQVTVRMNDSTLVSLGLSENPYFKIQLFDGDSANVTDTSYMAEHSRYFDPVSVETEHYFMYSYIRLVYENVEIESMTDMMLCLCPTKDSADVSQLVVHFREQALETYKLSSSEKKLFSED